MAIWGIIKNLKFREISTLSRIFIKHPRYFVPTIKATLETIKICDFKFGDTHHLNNPTNAFRHAYWNYLICANCFRVSGSLEGSVQWAEKVTNLHEELSPNSDLARAMDLHNNKIGREIFLKNPREIAQAGKLLRNMLNEAKLVGNLEDIKNNSNQLVFIEK